MVERVDPATVFTSVVTDRTLAKERVAASEVDAAAILDGVISSNLTIHEYAAALIYAAAFIGCVERDDTVTDHALKARDPAAALRGIVCENTRDNRPGVAFDSPPDISIPRDVIV